MHTPTPESDRAAIHCRRGFSLVEVIVGLAIMTMIAAVVTPVLFGALDKARLDRATSSLDALVLAFDQFEDDVKEHPGTLSQLAEPITPAQQNVCDLHYKPGPGKGGTDTWDGPYLNRFVDGGLPLGIGIAQNDLGREGQKNKAGALLILITGVTPEDAAALDERVDGFVDPAAGTVRYGSPSPSTGLVEVTYRVPSPRC